MATKTGTIYSFDVERGEHGLGRGKWAANGYRNGKFVAAPAVNAKTKREAEDAGAAWVAFQVAQDDALGI